VRACFNEDDRAGFAGLRPVRRWPEEVADMSRADRGFALFLMVVLIALSALFFELFPRHGEQSVGGDGATAPAGTPSPQPAQK